jgi:hypothetical protein
MVMCLCEVSVLLLLWFCHEGENFGTLHGGNQASVIGSKQDPTKLVTLSRLKCWGSVNTARSRRTSILLTLYIPKLNSLRTARSTCKSVLTVTPAG